MSEEDLPEGWARTALADLLPPGGLFDGPFGSNLKTADYTSTGVRVVRLENLANLRFIEEKRTFISREKYRTLEKHTVREGDILFGSFVDEAVRVGLLPRLPTPAIAKADCFCLRPRSDLVHPAFLMYQLGTNATKESLLSEIHGATRPRITTRQLRALSLSLPPIAEQTRIATAIGVAIEDVRRAQARLSNVDTTLARFRQAVLAAAFNGRLSHGGLGVASCGESPSDDDAASSVPVVAAASLFEVADYGTSVRCDRDVQGGIPVLRIPNIASGRLDTSDLKFAPRNSLKAGEADVREGDILVCRTNGSLDLIGKAAVVRGLSRPHSFASYLIRLRVRGNSVLPDFFHLFLSSPAGRDQIERESRTTAGQYNLNLRILNELELPLPPLPEQREIVRRVESLFALADDIEKRVAAASARADKLTQAILAKAFRGELVPTEAELNRRREAASTTPPRAVRSTAARPASRRSR